MGVKTTIQDGLIDRVELYTDKTWFLRLDVLPFAVSYAFFFSILTEESLFHMKYWALVGIPVVLSIHLLLFLTAQSSVKFRCLIGKSKTLDIEKAKFVLVFAAKNAGKDKIVEMQHLNETIQQQQLQAGSITVFDQTFTNSSHSFSFQEVSYLYNSQHETFIRLDYPVELSTSLAMKWQGFGKPEITMNALRRWGLNEFSIPLPHFLDLYMVNIFILIDYIIS
jgi:hypothetical protein